MLPLAQLEKVMASQGNWATVATEISTLMASGNLGQTIFTFAGLLVNASQYKQKIDKLLDELFAGTVDQAAVSKFKEQAEEASVAFKAISLMVGGGVVANRLGLSRFWAHNQ